jgi:signal transduction histidine kinase
LKGARWALRLAALSVEVLMVQEQQLDERPGLLGQLQRLISPNIRGKIIMPYLVLTLIVAVVGFYVILNFVHLSLDERLNNHLLEAGRVVSDSMAYQELEHLESARLVAFTQGLAEAVRERDLTSVSEIGERAAVAAGAELLVVVDMGRYEILHVLQREDGVREVGPGQAQVTGLWVADELIQADNASELPRRGIGLYPVDDRYYYLTAIPIGLEGEMVGVVVVGTSLDTLVPFLKSTSLANVTLYVEGGLAIASSFELGEEQGGVGGLSDDLGMSAENYATFIGVDQLTIIENVMVRGRRYRLANGPLQIANHRFGVFSVALPSDFIVEANVTSRQTYVPALVLAMGCVILVGYVISQRITNPLARLVRTSQSVAEGDLEQRTGIVSRDEVGVLAATFDVMTGRLAERTRELQRLYQAQKEIAGRMQAILSSIGDGVILEDLEGNFIPLNDTAREILDEMATDFMLGPLQELFAGDGELEGSSQASPWLLDSRRFQVGKNVLSTHTAAVRTEDGERLGTVVVLRDVTAEVEAEQVKDSFIAHVSHELRTPLTAIRGYIGLLLSGAGGSLDDDQRNFLQTISRHTESLISMVNELLDFSEMEAGRRLGLRRRPTSLKALLEDVVEEWRPQMSEKGLEFEVELSDELPEMDVDDGRLRWAFVNLMRNAWQYTSVGQVTLKLYEQGGYAVIDVMDSGAGIAPDDLQRVFSRFHRVMHGPGTDDEVRGLGLGLYLTKAIIEAHGGEVTVTSELGEGSTFQVTLPVL